MNAFGNTPTSPHARPRGDGAHTGSPRRLPTRPGVRHLVLALVSLLVAAAGAQNVTVLTHDSFALPEALVEAFEEEHGLSVSFVSGGDAGEALNRALLTRERPIADVLYGVDNSLIGREGAPELFEPYRSPQLEHVDDGLLFAGERLTPIDIGYVAFNVDPAALEERDVPIPEDLTDLTEPAYEGLTVVSDPASSSPGLAFLMTTVARFGEDGDDDWLDYWAELRDNDLQVVGGWSDAYYTAFTRYGGDRPIVLSYATSPAAEAIFAEEPPESAPTVNLLCDQCAWRQIEAAGILEGSDDPEAARAFIDFMLSEEVQEALPTSMFVYPVREGTPLPEAYDRFAAVPSEAQTAELDAQRIAENQERWLQQWTRVVRQGRSPDEVR